MADITQEQFEGLQRDLQETRVMMEGVLKALGVKNGRYIAHVKEYVESGLYTQSRQTRIWNVNLGDHSLAHYRFMEADLTSLEAIAEKPRAEIVALSGIGRVTMQRLEAAMAERGLTFAEAA